MIAKFEAGGVADPGSWRLSGPLAVVGAGSAERC